MMRMVMAALLVLTLAAPVAAQNSVTVKSRVEADRSTTLVHEVVVNASQDRVWTAISTPEGWRTWAVPYVWQVRDRKNVIETSQARGAKLGGPENIKHEFLVAIPQRMLVFRTIGWPQGFDAGPALADVRWIFELVPLRNKRTLVRLTSVGFGATPMAAGARNFFVQANKESLANLQRRFVRGPLY